jgi:hypothetical protein
MNADSLEGSDFMFVSILPGDFEEMAVDGFLRKDQVYAKGIP